METSQLVVLIIGIVAIIVGTILAFIGRRSQGKLRVIQDTPTVNAGEVARMVKAAGSPRVEVKGTVSCEQPLISPRSQTPCVYYRYKLEHRVERQVRDSQGNYRTEEHWDTVESSKEELPFLLSDATGSVWVIPNDADFVLESQSHIGYGRPHDDRASTGSVIGDVVGGVLDSLDGRYDRVSGYRVTEEVLRVGQPAYVLGIASRSADGTASLGKGEGPFIISHKMEEELTKRYGRNYILQYVFGAILAVGGIAAIIYSLAVMG